MKSQKPYIKRVRIEVDMLYNPEYGDDRICVCGHQYYRHFDWMENDSTTSCKYCSCYEFIEGKPVKDFTFTKASVSPITVAVSIDVYAAWGELYRWLDDHADVIASTGVPMVLCGDADYPTLRYRGNHVRISKRMLKRIVIGPSR